MRNNLYFGANLDINVDGAYLDKYYLVRTVRNKMCGFYFLIYIHLIDCMDKTLKTFV